MQAPNKDIKLQLEMVIAIQAKHLKKVSVFFQFLCQSFVEL